MAIGGLHVCSILCINARTFRRIQTMEGFTMAKAELMESEAWKQAPDDAGVWMLYHVYDRRGDYAHTVNFSPVKVVHDQQTNEVRLS